MNKIIPLIIGCFLAGILTGSGYASEKTLLYQEIEDVNSPSVVIGETKIIQEEKGDRTVIKRTKQFDTYLVKDEFDLDREQSLIKWRRVVKEQDTDFTAQRDGEVLNISGTLDGAPIDKQIELGTKALHIYPKYSLSKFALSGVPRMELWSLRRDELDKLPMKAERKGIETITINGEEVEVIKIYYAIKGKLREKHFNHNYYYRKSDGLYLKKEENTGRVETLINES